MSFVAIAQQSLAEIFATLGEPAEFRAWMGSSLQPPVPGILVMPTIRDDIAGEWELNRVRDETLFDVQVQQLVTVPKKSRFTLLEQTWEVSGEAHRDDKFGLVWTFGCRKV